MLDKLDNIPWADLQHAYGEASDVPEQIRLVTSPDEKTREKAWWSLYGNIFHQGTRYEATPYAIPFFYELLLEDSTPDKEFMVRYLVSLALGYEESYLPNGVVMNKFKEACQSEWDNMSKEDKVECKEYGFSPLTELACYEKVEAGVPILLQLAQEDDLNTSWAAIYALAWFPAKTERSFPVILKQLSKYTNEKDIVNALLSLGLLAKSSTVLCDMSALYAYLQSDTLSIRVAAAIALTKHPLEEKLLPVLLEGLVAEDEMKELSPFNSGDLVGYICVILSEYGKGNKEAVVAAMCKVLDTVSTYEALGITNSLLGILYADQTPTVKDKSVNELTDLEIMSLEAIANCKGWSFDGKSTFGNYTSLVRHFGIPSSQEDLKAYLQQKTQMP